MRNEEGNIYLCVCVSVCVMTVLFLFCFGLGKASVCPCVNMLENQYSIACVLWLLFFEFIGC